MSKPAHMRPASYKCAPFALLVFLAVFCVLGVRWTFSQWEELSVNEVFFTLRALQGTGNGMIENFLLTVLLPAGVCGILAWLFFRYLRQRSGFVVVRRIVAALGIVAVVGSVAYLWQGMDVTGYILHSQTDEDFIAETYVDPAAVEISFPEKKRNLIFVYLESMETSYTDKAHGGSFDTSFIPELTEIALQAESFSGEDGVLNGGYSMPDTTWTTGAMVAQTSGLPLKIPIDGNAMSSQEAFFPGVVALGDILDDAGYRQVLFIGSDAAFGARKFYFESHRNYEMLDYLYAKEKKWIPEDYAQWWGYEDEKLFAFAKDQITEMASAGTPFNFTLLTADTHFPSGYECRLCKHDFESGYGNVLACSSRQTAEFISWCTQQDFYDNTTIVLVGDHPTMDSEFVKLIDSEYDRRVFTAFLNVADGVKSNGETRTYTTFDMFPTTLAALGVRIEGDKLGLGTNLFSNTPTLTETIGLDEEKDLLQYPSAFMEDVAAISEDTLMLQEQLSRAEATVSCTPAKDDVFTLQVSIDPADAAKMDDLYVYLSPSGVKDTRELVMDNKGDGNFTLEVDMADFDQYGPYSYKLRAKTSAGFMDFGQPGEVNPL